jgi:hypothetical protein
VLTARREDEREAAERRKRRTFEGTYEKTKSYTL